MRHHATFTGFNLRSVHVRMLLQDVRGSVFVEYTVLLVLVAVICSLALVAAGVPLVQMFVTRQTWLLLPFP
jgi:Flp pilus assembly pilin Flp